LEQTHASVQVVKGRQFDGGREVLRMAKHPGQVCFVTDDGYMTCNFTVVKGKERHLASGKWAKFRLRKKKAR
jgi:hypothetical protein